MRDYAAWVVAVGHKRGLLLIQPEAATAARQRWLGQNLAGVVHGSLDRVLACPGHDAGPQDGANVVITPPRSLRRSAGSTPRHARGS